MRQRIGAMIVGFCLVLGIALLQQQGQRSQGQARFPDVPTRTPVVVSPAVRPPVPQASLPQVRAERLFSHVQALAFERDGARDRAQARAYLRDTLSQLGWKPTLQRFEQGVNVLAERPGTDPKAGKILVAAHYDSVPGSPGADDNASGVAVVLEVARLLRQPTARSLQVAFFDREERGLLGSRAFAGEDRRLLGLKGVIVLDMVGYACRTPGCQTYPEGLPVKPPSDRGDFIGILVDQEHANLLQAFPPKQTGLPPTLTLAVPFRGLLTPDLLRSDHAPFWHRGVGAMLLTDTANFRSPHYHQPSDRPATLDRAFLTGVAQLVVNATATLLKAS